jgi:hypothetical protein
MQIKAVNMPAQKFLFASLCWRGVTQNNNSDKRVPAFTSAGALFSCFLFAKFREEVCGGIRAINISVASGGTSAAVNFMVYVCAKQPNAAAGNPLFQRRLFFV